MRKIRLEIAGMCETDKRIGDYRIKQTDKSVVVGQRKGLASSIFDFMFGMAFMSPLGLLVGVFLFKNGVFGMKPDPNISQISTGNWLIILPFLCVSLVFAYIGFFVAFARSHVDVANEKIFIGNSWCGVPLKLKATPVSEISSIQLKWELGGGMFGRRWCCVATALTFKKAKPIRLFSCSNRESALELAGAVAQITNLTVRDIPQP